MTVDPEDSNFIFVPEIDLLVCPLIDLCNLPKHGFLCKTPDCKELCPEYLTKVKELMLKEFS